MDLLKLAVPTILFVFTSMTLEIRSVNSDSWLFNMYNTTGTKWLYLVPVAIFGDWLSWEKILQLSNDPILIIQLPKDL